METLELTHIEKIKAENDFNASRIQRITGLNEQQWCELVFNSGLDYARLVTAGDTMGRDLLIKSRFFWQWWKNEWAARDRAYLDTYRLVEAVELQDDYLFMHSSYRLTNDPKMRYKHAFMIGQCFDELHRQKGAAV